MRCCAPFLSALSCALISSGCFLSHVTPVDLVDDNETVDQSGAPTSPAIHPGGREGLRDRGALLGHPVTAIDAGANTTCAIRNAEVYCWGYGTGGLLGGGYEEENASAPRHLDLPGSFVGVEVGPRFACAWRDDGQAFCWGNLPWEWSADLPSGNSVRTPSLLSLSNVQAMSIAGGQACAVASGQNFCWGYEVGGSRVHGVNGPLRADPYLIQEEGRFYVSQRRRCVLDAGQLRCVGDLFNLQEQAPEFAPVGFGDNIIDASFGRHHACALNSDGGLRCMGWNAEGQIDGRLGHRPPPTDVRLSGFHIVGVAVGESHHTCALVEDGSVWCWGANSSGEAGVISGERLVLEPTQVDISNVRTLATGNQHTCALLADGSAWCWGYARHGQLGDGHDYESGAVRNSPTPVQVQFD